MGALTRAFNWEQTPLGMPDRWPQSLRTTVSIVLSSRFPMFLWWGDDLIQFYNDAYRPSLGNDGKHPAALGQKGKDCWPEIWDIIYPLIRTVQQSGEAIWSEDQLIPIYRNGKMEDVYWTFSYSPVPGDTNNIDGILVVCTETTDKILNLKRLEQANKQFSDLVMQAPVAVAVFRGDDFVAETVNNAYLPIVGKTREEFAGKPLFDSLPETRPVLEPIARELVRTGIPFPAREFEIVINRNGRDELCYFNSIWEPLRENDGRINGFIVVAHEVTDHVISRKIIEESEERFRTMAEATDVLIAVGDETSNATYLNKAWAELTGRPAADLLKSGWTDLIHPDDRHRYLKIYLDAFALKDTFTAEFRILNKEGGYSWLLAKGQPRSRPDSSFAGYISSCVDITDRKITEQALKESEQRVRTIVENAPFPIAVYAGSEMRITLANQAILSIWGKGNDVVGKLFSEVLPELDNQHVFTQIDMVFTTGQAYHARNQRLDLLVDGRLRPYYFNYSFTPLFDIAGKVYGVMNTGADVTDLNLAKLKVEENEKSIRNTILKAPVAMCIFRGPLHIVEIANDRMIELWGRSSSEVLGKPIFEGLPEAKDQGFEQLLASVYTTGEAFMAEDIPITLPRNNSIEPVYVNFVYEAYREANGDISGIIAVAVDVTPQVLARQKIEQIVAERTRELAEANNNLLRSNDELAQFAYIASHDLQEPLRKIATFSQMLEQNLGDIDSRSRNYLGKINSASSRMLALIRDVLAYSQLSKPNDVFEPVDINKVITDICVDFELLIEQKGAAIACKGLPVIEAIPLQMSQLFGNLISNALKFTRPGIMPEIHIEATPLSDDKRRAYALPAGRNYFNIQLKDNGIGFRPEYASQIFNIFQRLHNKNDYAGTGIGLALCKKIADNHNGCIFAAPGDEYGAVFNVILPSVQRIS